MHDEDDYPGFQREPFGGLTEEEIEKLVMRVSERVVADFYQNIGRSVTNKFFWLVGIGIVAFLTWLGLTGKLKGAG